MKNIFVANLPFLTDSPKPSSLLMAKICNHDKIFDNFPKMPSEISFFSNFVDEIQSIFMYLQ